jgi:transposase
MFAELRVGRPTRRRLARMDRKSRDADVRIRCRILLKVIEGASCRSAARALGCAPSTAARMVARFRDYGEAAVWDGRQENGTRKVDADVEAGIREILTKTAQECGFTRPSWTLEALAQVVAEVLGVGLSVGHLWKILRRLRVRWGRPRPVVVCPWKAARRKARIRALRRLAARSDPREVVVFADEVDLHLNPKIGPDWMLPGQQRTIVTPGQNEKRYLAGAYDPRRQRLVYVEGDRKASWLFLNLLRALLAAYRGKRTIHVILDNYSIHKSRLVQSWLAAHGAKIRLEFLPPYCPQENRIERLWLDLHANVTRNHRCRTMAQLMAAVHEYLVGQFEIAEVQARAA